MEERNVLIRKLDKVFVDKLCNATGTTVGTKAFLIAADFYLQQHETVSQLKADLQELKERLTRHADLLREISPLCHEMSAICTRLTDAISDKDLRG